MTLLHVDSVHMPASLETLDAGAHAHTVPTPAPALTCDHATPVMTIQLQPFWAKRPALWFAQAEAHFELAGVTAERMRYWHVVANLGEQYAVEVEDIIFSPPTESPYTYLKGELIRRFSPSEQQRMRQLMNEELGERTPSRFLRRLRHLAGNVQTNDALLRQIWLKRLPASVQAILVAQGDMEIEKLADLADRVLEVFPTAPTPVAVQTATAPSETAGTDPVSSLTARLDDLLCQVAQLLRQQRSRHGIRSQSRAN